MSTAAEYRQFAVECLRLTRETPDPSRKARYLQMAQGWASLAVADDVSLATAVPILDQSDNQR